MRVAKPTVYNGIRFRSRFEANVYQNAESRGVELEYERERLTYVLTKVYRADFRIPGTNIIIEAKGHFPAADRAKMLAVRDMNPDFDFRLLFQDASTKIRRGAKTTYGQWADRNGFEWAEGVIPEGWLNVE